MLGHWSTTCYQSVLFAMPYTYRLIQRRHHLVVWQALEFATTLNIRYFMLHR